MNRDDAVVLSLTVLTVIVVPGLANWFFGTLGHPTLGSVVWALGYGVGVLFIWYEWVRPLDIRAPEGVERSDDSADE